MSDKIEHKIEIVMGEQTITGSTANIANDKGGYYNGYDGDKQELVKANSYNKEYGEKLATESAKTAAEIFKKDKKIDKVIVKQPLGFLGGSMSVIIQKDVKNSLTGTSGPRVGIKSKGFMPGKAAMNKIKDQLVDDLND